VTLLHEDKSIPSMCKPLKTLLEKHPTSQYTCEGNPKQHSLLIRTVLQTCERICGGSVWLQATGAQCWVLRILRRPVSTDSTELFRGQKMRC